MKFLPKRNDGFANHPFLAVVLTLFNIAGIMWGLRMLQNPSGTYSYPQSGGGSSSSSGGGLDQTINPLSYGAKWDAKFTYSGVFSSGSATVTCQSVDCQFTSADVGKIVFGFESPFSANNGVSSYATLLTQTTISAVNNATSITVGTTASASCNNPSSAVCILVWGSQDDATAINAAVNAAWTTAGSCKALQFPNGFALIGSPVMNALPSALSSACGGTISGSTSGIDLTQSGPEVFGQGPGNTLLIPLPSFNYAGCTFGLSTHGCIGTTPNLEAHDFGVFGAGQSAPAGNPTVTLFELNGSQQGGSCTGSTGFNLTLSNWAVQDANATGFDMGQAACGAPMYTNDVAELFGGVKTCNITSAGTVVSTYTLACFGNYINGGSSVQMTLQPGSAQAPGVINTDHSYFANCAGTAAQCAQVTGSAGMWNSKGDFIACVSATGCTPVKTAGGSGASVTLNLDGDSVAVGFSATGGQAIWLNALASTMHVKNSVVIGTGTNTSLLQITAGNKFFDDGGNSFSNGTVANGIPAGTFFGSGSACQAVQVAGNFADGAGLGTSTFGTLSGTNCHGQVTITYAGALTTTPSFTMTFVAPQYLVAPSCTLTDVGGTNAFPTQIANGAISTSSVVFNLTFAVAPTATNTDIFVWNCSP